MAVLAAARHLEKMAGGQVVGGVEHRERNMERAQAIGWVRAALQGARWRVRGGGRTTGGREREAGRWDVAAHRI